MSHYDHKTGKVTYPNLRMRFGYMNIIAISVAALFFLVGGVGYVVSQAVPWEPFEINSYEVAPSEICPGDQFVQVRLQRTLKSHVNLSEGPNTDVESQWISGNGDITPAASATVNLSIRPRGSQNLVAPVDRITPQNPGTYKLETMYTIRGTRFIYPVSQQLTESSEEVLTVLPAKDKHCDKKERIK